MLHSASNNESGVPQQLLDAKQQEIKERREREAAIQVCDINKLVTSETFQPPGGFESSWYMVDTSQFELSSTYKMSLV